VRQSTLPAWWAWSTLLIAAQAAALFLQRAGKTVAYQHWAFERLGSPLGWIAVGVLALQAAAVVRYRDQLVAFLRPLAAGAVRWRVVAAAGCLVALAAVPSLSPARYAAELVAGVAVQVLAAANIVLLVASWPATGWARLRAWLEPPADAGAARLGITLIALGTVVVTAGLSVVIYERVPHVPDEIIYLLHARYFAEGRLDIPLPPVPGGFDVDLLYYDTTRAFGTLPPGWPAVLAVGVKLGSPWLVNPVLTGVCVVLLYILARMIDGERTARLAALLFAASPWVLFLGMSLMTHTASLACALAAAIGVAAAKRRSAWWPTALAGIGVGAVSLMRPLEGLALALVLGVWSLTARAGAAIWRLAPAAALTLSTVAVGSIARWYNAALTGSASRFPIMMYNDLYYAPGANDLGFGPNRGQGWSGLDPWPGHGLRDVILNTVLNGTGLQTEVFGWGMGSLTAIFALLLIRRLSRLDGSLAATVVFVAAIHSLYFFSGGPDFGARYWFLAVVPLVLLTSRGATTAARELRPRLATGLVLMSALSVPVFMSWRAVDKYRGFRRMDGSFREFTRGGLPKGVANPLVLIRGGRHPDFHMAANENPFDLQGATGPVYAWDRTPEIRARVIAAFPDRPIVIVDGPTLTGGGYRIVAGPLPAGSLASDVPSSEQLPAIANRRSAQGRQRAPDQ
jgi:hypothetical protein